jgi:hypothetical protein
MKYLKYISESLDYTNYLTEIKDFTDTCLAYLLDEYFEVVIFGTKHTVSRAVRITKKSHEQFYWDDVKDQIIPYLKLFKNKVSEIKLIEIGGGPNKYQFTYNEVINDKIYDDSLDNNIRSIYIFFEM